jgi:pullulanase
MNKAIMLFAMLIPFSIKAQNKKFASYPVYNGTDLGLAYSPQQSFFRIWAPSADKAELKLYNEGTGGKVLQTISMKKDKAGTWTASLRGDQKGRFYVFRVQEKNKWLNEVPDPYAKIVGVNGKRAMIADLKETHPSDWSNDKSPEFKNPTDAIIYELHVRDASIAINSGISNKGKFLGLTETGTINEDSLSTGLDHLKELGVTHIHLLPSYDFYSVDESKLDKPQYNWGYDPLNYNTPEGSYSTDPADGRIRIKEFKQLIKTFHENGLKVVMDVVYNHTMLTEDSYFNQLVPGYYYRQTKDGKFSNATACGNETASERPMMRKFMLESMAYWVKEYHVDGFRVDLMGVHDIKTMNLISKELRKIKQDILLYGEGWTAGASPLADSLRALKKYAYKLDSIAVFSDDVRDGIKGSVFEHEDRGFASGKPGMQESIKFGIVASCKHPQVEYDKVNYSKAPYAKEPYHTVTYAECHDNHVLWDKLAISAKNATEADRKEMHKLALGIVLTSQGISFLHAGTEFLRTKNGNENSFNAGDSINAIDWSLKTKNADVVEYVKTLIKMRKEHPAFRMSTAKDIAEHIRFKDNVYPGIICYTINGEAVNDSWKKIMIFLNGTAESPVITIPDKQDWTFFIGQDAYKNITMAKDMLVVPKYSCMVLYQE